VPAAHALWYLNDAPRKPAGPRTSERFVRTGGGSAAAHPGGGVHGICGFLAARAALGEHGWAGGLCRRVTSAALDLVHGPPAS